MDELEALPRTVDEIAELTRMVETMIERSGSTLPKNVLHALNQLNAELITVQEKVGNLEEEWGSLRALAEIGHVVNSSLEVQTVLSEVMDKFIMLTGAQRAFLMLQDVRD